MKKLFMTLALLLLSVPAYALEVYTIDPRHTFPYFEVNHMGLSTQRGRFNSTKGTITLDREAKKGSVAIEIDAASVSTGLGELEKHLRSEDFFNVEKYPTILFKSSEVEFEGEKIKSIKGELTMLGVTRPATLTVSSFDCKVHPMTKKYVCGAEAATTIKRSEFGMNYLIKAIGDEVKISMPIEAVRN